MLVLQVYRKKVLWGHGGFHMDFKGKPGSSGSVWQCQDPCRQPLRGQCTKLWGWSQSFSEDSRKLDMPEMWNTCQRKPQAAQERGQVGYSQQATGTGSRGPWCLTWGYRSQCLPCWVLILLWSTPFHAMRPFLPLFWNGNVYFLLFVFGSMEFVFDFTGLIAKSLPRVLEETLELAF
jgi:hypothetical protein